MIFPIQVRAARILLGLSQQDLADRASVSLGTIKRIEAARFELAGTAQTMARIQQALESAGIVFIDQDAQAGPGVRLRRPISP
jgi:transcriptional regulator with XRE-family HTH domain